MVIMEGRVRRVLLTFAEVELGFKNAGKLYDGSRGQIPWLYLGNLIFAVLWRSLFEKASML